MPENTEREPAMPDPTIPEDPPRSGSRLGPSLWIEVTQVPATDSEYRAPAKAEELTFHRAPRWVPQDYVLLCTGSVGLAIGALGMLQTVIALVFALAGRGWTMAVLCAAATAAGALVAWTSWRRLVARVVAQRPQKVRVGPESVVLASGERLALSRLREVHTTCAHGLHQVRARVDDGESDALVLDGLTRDEAEGAARVLAVRLARPE